VTDEPLADAETAAARFQCDLYRYWRAARRAGPLALGARGHLALAAFRRLAAALSAGAPEPGTGESSSAEAGEPFQPRLLFMRRLLERLDLLERRGDQRLAASDPAAMAAYLDLPLAERLRCCARVWIAGGWWPDAPDARRPLPAARTPAPPRIALARRHLLHDLLALSPDASLPIPAPPALTSAARGRARARTARTSAVDGTTERTALLGPLGWLGLVEVEGATVSDDRAARCRATPALAALRDGAADAELAEGHGRITIQPNFEIVAYPPHTAPSLFALDHCAEARGTDRVARYALTRRAFAGARRLGWPAGAVAARLAVLAGGAPLPPNVAVTLADWDRQADRLTLHAPVTLLEVADAALLDALLHDRQAAGWVARRLAPGAALIHERHQAEVRAWLLRRGEMPAMADRTADAAPGEMP
jgi:hypothetical protein